MRAACALLLAVLAVAPAARAGWWSRPSAQKEEDAFSAASQMMADGTHDAQAVVQAFEAYLRDFPDGRRAADARFLIGEESMRRALKILGAESADEKKSASRLMAPANPAATQALEDARKAFESVAGDDKSGLGASAQYRLGEVAYDQGDWQKAIEQWRLLGQKDPKSYILGQSMIGIVFADIALERFAQAESDLFLLGETFPTYLRLPEVLYASGIVALHKGDYVDALQDLSQVKTAEAQYYLGKTYLLSHRAYKAAATFENLLRDYPGSELCEEARFFIGDSFFLAEDYDGAIAKYQRFLELYPHSRLRVSATYRIGSSYFQKKQYVEARANFQAVLDGYPNDFFAPLAQYGIAESYLAAGQTREALFAYAKVLTRFASARDVLPLARYKLAWTQYQIGDYKAAAQTARDFVSLYPGNSLCKNVYLIMGNALVKLGQHSDAVDAFQRIIDLDPSSEIAEQALFSILQDQFGQKAYDSILTSYQYIFHNLPPSRSKWRALSDLYAAEAYLKLNRLGEAQSIYEMILKVYPDQAAAFYAQDGLAWVYAYKGDDEHALQERQKLQDMLSAASSSFTFTGANELGIADSLFNQKSYEDASRLYDQYVKDNPQAPEAAMALYKSGLSLYHQSYYSQAIEKWRALIAGYPRSPQTPVASYQVADTLFRAQKYPEAEAEYKRIISSYPDSPQLPTAFLRLAQIAYDRKDDPAALKLSQSLIARFPDAPEANDGLDLAEAVFDRDQKVDYRSALRAIIAAVPGKTIAGEAQFRLARRLFDEKRYAEAADEFQKFSVDYTNHPEVAKAQFYLGESEFDAGQYANAVPAFERFLNNFDGGKQTSLALFHLAGSCYQLKDYDRAARYYSRLIEEYPDSDSVKAAQFNLALTYKAQGKLDMAQYAYQKYAEAAGPGDPAAAGAYWEIYAIQKQRKDYEGALATLERIRAAAKGSGVALEALYRMSEIDLAMNRPDEAMNAWEKLRALKPAGDVFRLQALIKLGQAYEKASDCRNAIAVYEDLSRHAPQRDVARSALARARLLRRSCAPAETGKKARRRAEAGAGEGIQ